MKKWPLLVAGRYFQTKKKDRGFAPSILSVVGIAVGVMTLMTVIGVMNGFQIGFIEDILEISSFHIRIENDDTEEALAMADEIHGLDGISSVLLFMDAQTLMLGEYSDFEPVIMRGLPADARRLDPGFFHQLNLIQGGIDRDNPGSVVLGNELAHVLGVQVGDPVTVMTLGGDSGLRPVNSILQVTGLFKSGYYEFDRGMALVALDEVTRFAASGEKSILGIKLENRYRDSGMISRLETLFPDLEPGTIVSWREFNSSFFGALRMEKLAMMVLIGLIFIVVGGNIYHSLKRSVFERIDEISLLKSIGGDTRSIRRIFIFDGILIGSIGSIAGSIIGLAISYNINKIFRIFEIVSNFFLGIIRQIVSPLVSAGMDEIAVFSPRYYYMSEVPVKLPFQEVLFIAMFAFFASVVASWFASRKILQIRPNEVLRYE